MRLNLVQPKLTLILQCVILGWLEGDRNVGIRGTNKQFLESSTLTRSEREDGSSGDLHFPD